MQALLNRNLLILFTCQIIFVSGSVLLVTLGGVVGHELASSPSLATLPVALMVVGTAMATIPAALSMRRFGRPLGFAIGTLTAALGAGLAIYALEQRNFVWFCTATTCIGASLAFSQQFRFAAAESVSLDKVGMAVSFILLGSICGAFAGPALVTYAASENPNAPYGLGFYYMVAAYLFSGFLVLMLRSTHIAADNTDTSSDARSLLSLITTPVIATAIIAGIVGQGVMTYVMTATPISMTVNDGFDLAETSAVIRAHVIAMYLPSLITPWLINRIGLQKMMAIGVLCMAITIVAGLLGQHYMHYWWALVLLGVGWNFLFVGGTTLLVQSYRSSERFHAQAVNDFSVFGTSAASSLLAGSILHVLGWHTLLLSVIPALFLMLGALWWTKRESAVLSQ